MKLMYDAMICYRSFINELHNKNCIFDYFLNNQHIILKHTYNTNIRGTDSMLTHWGRVTHICVSKLTIIGSHNGMAPGRRQTIIWTNDGILLIAPLGTNLSEILIGIQTFPFKKMHLKMSSAKWRPFCLRLKVLTHYGLVISYGDTDLGQHWLR